MPIIYISGYSRCGSTILGMLLGSHPLIQSVGEVSNLPEDWTFSSRICTCGAPFAQCEFWSPLHERFPQTAELSGLLKRIESRRSVDALLDDELDGADVAIYKDYVKALVAHVREHSGKTYMLDSSKTARDIAGRPIALHRYSGEDVYVIHLVRSLEATMESYLRNGSNWANEGRIKPPKLPGLRSMVGWILANRAAMRTSEHIPASRYLPVSYDSLLHQPEFELKRIGAFTGIDMSPVLKKLRADEPLRAQHDVGGNRLRHHAQALRPPGREPNLPVLHRFLAWAVTHPLFLSHIHPALDEGVKPDLVPVPRQRRRRRSRMRRRSGNADVKLRRQSP